MNNELIKKYAIIFVLIARIYLFYNLLCRSQKSPYYLKRKSEDGDHIVRYSDKYLRYSIISYTIHILKLITFNQSLIMCIHTMFISW